MAEETVLRYIFIEKRSEDSEIIGATKLKDIIKSLFMNVTSRKFQIDLEGTNYAVNYEVSYKDNENLYYLSLKCGESKAKAAKILDKTNTILCKGKHREDYNIVLSFDGVSDYYCNKLYPKLSIFERSIRELISNIIIPIHGNQWYLNTIPDNIKGELKEQTKGMKDSQLLEEALNEMTISQMITYLFKPYREADIYEILSDAEISSSIQSMTRDDLLDVYEKCKEKCLWDRFFEKDVELHNLQVNLERIRELRNLVAHNKHISYEVYLDSKRSLSSINKQLKNAINKIEENKYNKVDDRIVYETFLDFKKFTSSFDNMSKIISKKFIYELVDNDLSEYAKVVDDFKSIIINSTSQLNHSKKLALFLNSVMENSKKMDEGEIHEDDSN